MKKFIIAILLIMVMACGCASAAVPEPSEDFYVLDTANVLDIDTEGMIVFSNDLLYEDCGAQIVVAAVKTIGGEDIADYAYDMYNAWQIGNKDGEGFLLLLAIEEEDYYLLPGDGLDTVFTGGTLRGIMNDYLETDFAAGNYDAGVEKTFRRIFEMVADACGSNVTVEEGIKLWETYMASDNAYTREDQDASPFGATQTNHNSMNYYAENETGRKGSGSFGLTTAIIILIVLAVIASAFGGRRYTHTHPGVTFFPRFRRPRVRRTPPPPPPAPGPRPGAFGGHPGAHRPGGFGAPRGGAPRSGGAPRMGGFGGSRSGALRGGMGASRPSGGRSGFGGGRSGGGGRSHGGGAGRGR